MKEYIEDRVLELAGYLISNKSTVRATAKKFGCSKSTVHKDLAERLPNINSTLAAKAKEILDFNKAERHIRGGRATKIKYTINKAEI
jgi:putative DeoR family transcriptional regulator (stage III sporulation protein D)